ncbi:hypothetical protein [Paenibacillus sp. LjRoot56]|uniref:hypothetical protein n=1 Tax=Paenibacillus sp. LjRoot56 TaxID=3342333 RepID=UPI003ECC6072
MQDDWEFNENENLVEVKKTRKIALLYILVFTLILVAIAGISLYFISQFFSSLCGAADCD